MDKTWDHPEQPRHFLSGDSWGDSSHVLQDQHQSWRELRETLMGHHRAMMEHHQTVKALYEKVQDCLRNGQEKEQAWQTYHTALRDHHQMIVEHHHMLQDYLRMTKKPYHKQGRQ